MRQPLALLGALAVFCTPSLARATCVTLCDARLVFDDCTSPASDVWPSDRALGVVVGCGDRPETTDGQPERRDGCYSSVFAHEFQLSRWTDDRALAEVEATLTENGACLGLPRFELDRPLPPGTYQLRTALAHVQFKTVDMPDGETIERAPLAALQCFSCSGGGPPDSPWPTTPPPPSASPARGCARCNLDAPGSSWTGLLCGLALLVRRRRRHR